MATLPTQLVKARPPTTGAYYTASALYNAGFRGWPLTIMTAIAGRESTWNARALNNNPATGDYSVGFLQINYYGNLLQSRSAEFGSPQYLQSDPQAQANAAYQLAGGNSLSGLSNWNLSASPSNGVVPTPLSSPNTYTIVPYLAQAAAAAAQVGTFGPASGSAIGNSAAWPGNGSPAVVAGGYTTSTAGNQSLPAGLASASGCAAKGAAFGEGGLLGIGSFHVTYCQLKAFTGSLIMVSGGVMIVVGAGFLLGSTVLGSAASTVARKLAPALSGTGRQQRRDTRAISAEKVTQEQARTQRELEAASNPRRRGSASRAQPPMRTPRGSAPPRESDDYLARTGETQF